MNCTALVNATVVTAPVVPEVGKSMVVYWYDIDGLKMPERPIMKLPPRRGATANPVPAPVTCEAPTPRPKKANNERLIGKW